MKVTQIHKNKTKKSPKPNDKNKARNPRAKFISDLCLILI